MIAADVRDDVLWLTLDRPEVGNALHPTLVDRLGQALETAARDDAVRVVVMTGAGKHFSAGADLHYMRSMAGEDREANEADALRTQRLFATVAESPKPVIARVNGAARGGGVGLLAAADVVVASATASFAFTEVRLGIVPAMIAPFVVARTGVARARRLFLTGETFGAADALDWGLVDHVADADQLDEAVARVCGELRRGGPAALAAVKVLLADVVAADPAEVGSLTARRIAALRASDEGQEGMRAFLEKRPPRWVR